MGVAANGVIVSNPAANCTQFTRWRVAILGDNPWRMASDFITLFLQQTLPGLPFLPLLPIMVVFAFLQKFITTGIATTGMK
jgi:hypothetical protein